MTELINFPDGTVQHAYITTDNANDDLEIAVLDGDLVILDTNENPVLRWDASATQWDFVSQDVAGLNQAAFGDSTADPTANGELQRNGADLKAFSGGSVRSLSDIGTGGLSVANVTSNQNTDGSGLYLVDTSSSAITLTLDTDDATGESIIGVVNVDGSNAVTVDTEGSETIDPGGEPSKTQSTAGWLVWYEGDGTNFDSSLAADVESVESTEINNDNYVEPQATASEGTSYNADLSTANCHKVTMTGDVTFDFTNADASEVNSLVLHLVQDGTGGRTPSFTPTVVWDGGSAPSWSTGANEEDLVTFIHDQDGSQWVGLVGGLGLA